MFHILELTPILFNIFHKAFPQDSVKCSLEVNEVEIQWYLLLSCLLHYLPDNKNGINCSSFRSKSIQISDNTASHRTSCHLCYAFKEIITNNKNNKSNITNNKNSKSNITNNKNSKSNITNNKNNKSNITNNMNNIISIVCKILLVVYFRSSVKRRRISDISGIDYDFE